MAKVFQYGSNCDEERLNSRLNSRLRDAAHLISRAQTVDNFEIAFDVWTSKNKCAAADLVRRGNKPAWGVLYEIAEDFIDGSPPDGGKTLAQIENGGDGKDGKYEKQCIQVEIVKGKTKSVVSAVTFLVKASARVSGKPTSPTYVEHIVKGMREQEILEEYIGDVLDTALETLPGQKHAADRARIEELRDGLCWT